MVGTRKITGGAVGLLAVGMALTGPALLGSLYRSAQEQVQQKVREYVDPDVLLREAVSKAESQLPKAIAAIKEAIRDTDQQEGILARTVEEQREGLRLIEQDLERLAAEVQSGAGCELRGNQLSAEQVRAEAVRLMEMKKRYEANMNSRGKLLEKLCRQKQDLQQQLARAEQAMVHLAHKTSQVQSQIALVKSAERIEQVEKNVGGRTLLATQSSLEQLDRQLQRQWQESRERARMRERLQSGDSYMEAVRERRLLEELGALYPVQGGKRDAEAEDRR